MIYSSDRFQADRTEIIEMSQEKLTSFIIPVYNEELNVPNVLRHLHSVLDEHPKWHPEVIVIDDGSTDHTRDVIEQELEKYL